MPHESHVHTSAASLKDRSSEIKQYWTVLAITGIIAVIQSVGGLASGSVALWADTLHVLLDGVGEGIALYIAYTVHTKTDSHTFRVNGMRASCAFLFLGVAWNAYEAYGRFSAPTDVVGWQVMIAAGIGTAMNAGKHRVIAHDDSPNAHGERLHIMQDVMIGLSVVLSGIAIWVTGWKYIDPVLSLLIAAYLAWSTLKLMINPPKESSLCGHAH